MDEKPRQTTYSSSIVSVNLQPQLKKRAHTAHSTPKSLAHKGLIRKKIEDQENQYAQLTLNSIHSNYPVSELKPFSTFYSVEKLTDDIQNSAEHKIKSSLKNNHKKASIYEKILSLHSTNRSGQNSTFYQSKRSKHKNKIRFNTTVNFTESKKKDEEEHMVIEFIKDDKEVQKKQKNVFESFNEKIKQHYPLHFQPNNNHQQSKCKSKSCNQGFFKRKKFRVEQKYEIDQPGFQKPTLKMLKTKKQKKPENIGFYVFSKSQNKIMSTSKMTASQQVTNNWSLNPSLQQIEFSMRQKFRSQSATMYKKYMRSSFYDRKKTIMQDLQIKMQ